MTEPRHVRLYRFDIPVGDPPERLHFCDVKCRPKIHSSVSSTLVRGTWWDQDWGARGSPDCRKVVKRRRGDGVSSPLSLVGCPFPLGMCKTTGSPGSSWSWFVYVTYLRRQSVYPDLWPEPLSFSRHVDKWRPGQKWGEHTGGGEKVCLFLHFLGWVWKVTDLRGFVGVPIIYFVTLVTD